MPVQSAYSPVIWTRSPFDEPYGSSPGTAAGPRTRCYMTVWMTSNLSYNWSRTELSLRSALRAITDPGRELHVAVVPDSTPGLFICLAAGGGASKHDKPTQCRFNVGPASNQHWVCWLCWLCGGGGARQTGYTDPILAKCWASIADDGSTLNQHWVSVGMQSDKQEEDGSKIQCTFKTRNDPPMLD